MVFSCATSWANARKTFAKSADFCQRPMGLGAFEYSPAPKGVMLTSGPLDGAPWVRFGSVCKTQLWLGVQSCPDLPCVGFINGYRRQSCPRASSSSLSPASLQRPPHVRPSKKKSSSSSPSRSRPSRPTPASTSKNTRGSALRPAPAVLRGSEPRIPPC